MSFKNFSVYCWVKIDTGNTWIMSCKCKANTTQLTGSVLAKDMLLVIVEDTYRILHCFFKNTFPHLLGFRVLAHFPCNVTVLAVVLVVWVFYYFSSSLSLPLCLYCSRSCWWSYCSRLHVRGLPAQAQAGAQAQCLDWGSRASPSTRWRFNRTLRDSTNSSKEPHSRE